MPQISTREFERLPLRVHDFLAGVPLHDVWAVDLPRVRSGITLDEFLRAAGSRPFTLFPIVRALLNIRLFVGRLFGWDREPDATVRETFATRLTTADRSKSLAPAGTREGPFRMVYRFENLRASGWPPDARVHGAHRPVPQVDRLSVAPARRSHDLEPNLRHGLPTPRIKAGESELVITEGTRTRASDRRRAREPRAGRARAARCWCPPRAPRTCSTRSGGSALRGRSRSRW